jgi:protein ImuA
LRLQVALSKEDGSRLDIHILKRRGPPLASPIQLPACSERMAALLAASQLRRKLRRQQEGVPHEIDSETTATATVVRIDLHQGKRHALDRTALAAA